MYNLIIVEDEPLMREYVSVAVDWSSLNINLLAVFSDAEAAIKSVLENNIHIIITDIYMPKLTGLEMIKELALLDREIKFIILSGYNEFKMVKEALTLGVSDYLLKSEFSSKELTDILKKIISELDNNKRLKVNCNDLLILKEKKIKDLFWSNSKKNTFARLTNSNYAVAVLKIFNFDKVSYLNWEDDKEILKYAIQNIINEILDKHNFGEMFFNTYQEIIIIFSSEEKYKALGRIHLICDEIIRILNENHRFTISIGLDYYTNNTMYLKKLYKNALKASEFSFIDGMNKVIDFESSITERISINYDILMNDFSILFKNSEFNKLIADIDRFFITKVDLLDVGELKSLYEKYFELVNHFAINNSIEINKDKYLDILKSKTVKELKEYFIEVITKFSYFCNEDIILMVKNYVQGNYNKTITLRIVAEKFHIDYSNLSKKFTSELGVGFSKYLSNVRINEAKKLINHGSYKLNEVALMVGFNNYENFSRVFYKVAGVYPKDYKFQEGDECNE